MVTFLIGHPVFTFQIHLCIREFNFKIIFTVVTSLTDHLALLTELGEPGQHDSEHVPAVIIPLHPVPGVQPVQ